MANLSEDIQYASSDTRPPMLDRTDFASWQQRIRLYCRERNEGTLHLGPGRPRVYSDLLPEDKDRMQFNSKFVNNMLPEWGRFITAVKLNRVDPLVLMSNVAPQHYNSQLSINPSSTYVPPHIVDNSQLDSGLSLTNNLIENLTNTLALLTQSYKTYLPQTNTQLRTSSNPRNQATVQDGRVVVQNVQGRQNRGQGNNARGAGTVGYRGALNRVGNANPGQAKKVKCYNYNAQENGVALDEKQLLFLAGGQDNTVDEDVDEQLVQDLALGGKVLFEN
ncbi:hypothetical protein Tco_1400767 [Tanacetum coccineum]